MTQIYISNFVLYTFLLNSNQTRRARSADLLRHLGVGVGQFFEEEPRLLLVQRVVGVPAVGRLHAGGTAAGRVAVAGPYHLGSLGHQVRHRLVALSDESDAAGVAVVDEDGTP